jgi:isopenicillin N synthase-like dioxygenase
VAEILEVDLTLYEHGSKEQQKALVQGTRQSLETGFVLVKSGLSEDLIDDIYGKFEEFYSWPFEKKMEYHRDWANGQTGYTPVGIESAAGEKTKDWKEMINVSSPLPSGHPFIKKYPVSYPKEQIIPAFMEKSLWKFHYAMADLHMRMLRIIAEGLEVHPDFFTNIIQDAPTLTRSLHYPPITEAPDDGNEYVLAGKHVDINIGTFLPRATKKGLQVLISDEWEDVIAPPGYVIYNKGIQLDLLTNGIFNQYGSDGTHRVVADPEHIGSRFSCVNFCHAKPSTILSPVATTITKENPQRYAGISADDALAEVLFKIGLLGNNSEPEHSGQEIID